METRSDIGGAAQARGEIRATVVQLAVSLPCQPTVAAMLRAAAAAGGAGAAPFCSGAAPGRAPRPPQLHRAPLASRPAPLPALPLSLPSLLAGSFPLQDTWTRRAVRAAAAPAAPDRAPTPGSPSGLPRGSPGPLLLPSGSCPTLSRRTPGGPRLPRRAVPGLGLRQLERLRSGAAAPSRPEAPREQRGLQADSSEQISSASPFRGDLPVKCP
ncbi:translation initiation factor IF-2-like [Corvus hawaiiensis]|uniref:translation initiation factor IF-2-like n=1 Tax=Corvus hawaiiensis TaxID=134902 RepID=UPI002018ED99|nr:translation initiation factor IF-2-like [Corvus hawaiiensis]XP_048161584.1 translation initiation factor IF-2-like [Corvus hawaiiensis]XP_048161585.1 translation initiation factor IF-2-like [Corvus hawaiiensis]